MTTKDRAELIQYINYIEAKAEEDRRSARKQDVQFISGWLSGCGNARKEVAGHLRKFIENSEVEFN